MNLRVKHNKIRVALSKNILAPRKIHWAEWMSILIDEIVWSKHKPTQNQNTARRGAAWKKFATLNFPQENITTIIRNEFPASINVPAILILFFRSCFKAWFPHVSVVVSFERQVTAGTKKRSVKVSLDNHKKERIKARTQNHAISQMATLPEWKENKEQMSTKCVCVVTL